MTRRSVSSAPSRGVRLDFKSGGWVLLLAALLSSVAVWWRVATVLPSLRQPALGDGRTIESYGFDLSTCLIDLDRVRPFAEPKNAVPALVNPPTLLPEQYDSIRLGRSKFLVSTDPVVCVELGGEARCYPVRLLIWHEVVNDMLGGVPIAVTYNPLCGSAAVYDRRVGGETLELHISGLFYNSNPLLFDKREGGRGESLWMQLTGQAVAGPAASRRESLRRIPVAMTHWAEWRAAHPDTSVLKPQKERMRVYKSEPYSQYATDNALRLPVSPLAPSPPALKAPCVGIRLGDSWHVLEVAALAGSADASGRAIRQFGDAQVTFACRPSPPAARVVDVHGAAEWDVAYAYWFAWHAIVGVDAVEPPPSSRPVHP